ncbi:MULTISPECIES: putative metalloprotease CJM1_0395 family protein [Halomonadaceae]|uniref:putative metalloprotease CJM1_0395 family protein n=1 Tax=Halomonadaceae TaxID=28256 RepID=UPI0015830B15|nr:MULTISPECIES: putative metalloprotease CJM1_0395 family protein [Halomonas]MDI4637796.1 SprA-related family protein [Halomonas sp. BMC7]NUJ58816.1 SprA-related family protein [Halomonas taeanensis]
MQVAPITAFQPTVQRPTGQVEAAAASRAASDKASAHQSAQISAQATNAQATSRIQPPKQADAAEPGQQTDSKTTSKSDTSERAEAQHKKANGEVLTEAELQQLDRLKQTDREVRQHEHAHQSSGGQYAGRIEYEYERGPDGQQYAVAGEVSIDSSPVPGDPAATIDKMEQVRAAATAPAEPSAQDRKVAAQANQHLIAARLELAMQQREMDGARNTTNVPQQPDASADGQSAFQPSA